MDFLTRMRSKSPIVRMQYALGIAGLVTGIITAVWLSTIPTRFAEIGASATTTETRTTISDEGDTGPTAPKAETEAEALGSLRMNGTTTVATSSSEVNKEVDPMPVASSTGPRVIQIGTTSQNAY